MPKRIKVVYLLVIATVLVGLLATNGSQIVIHATSLQTPQTQTEHTFGSELLLFTGTATAAQPTLPPGIQLHARWQRGVTALYIASGESRLLTAAHPAGNAHFTWEILDADTTGKVYYFVDVTAPDAPARAAAVGQVLYTDDALLLVAVAKADEEQLITRLPTAGIPLALLPSAPLPWPAAAAEPLSANAVTAAADPLITALLPLLTEDDLKTLIGELSGETPVTVGNDTITLNTRYTFATRIQDAERYLHQYYTQLGIAVSYAPWTYGSYSGRNVIAEIPGVEHPERIWLVGGHFDSISENPYNLAPGADDNGSGTAATMLIAKIFRTYQFADTVRFVHFSGEEQGHWGSIVYARDQKLKGAQIMGYIDLDMIGWDGNDDRVVELHVGTGPKSNTLGTAFASVNERYGQGLVIERKTDTASRFSDHSSFWDQDYAAFLAIENFFDGEYPRDRNPKYHNTGDKLALVDLNYVARYGRVALATMAESAGIRQPNPNATPTSTATSTSTPQPSPTATPLPTGCVDLIVNGGFEGTGGWSFGSTPAPAKIVNTVAYTGARSVLQGLPTGAGNVTAHSSAFQTVALPNTAQQLILRYWEQPGGTSDGADYRETLLLNPDYSALATLERTSQAVTDGAWRERTFDLTSYRGRNVVIYLNVYNNGTGSQLWRYVDQVALLACTGATATPTPTVTPTPTLTATVEPSPTPTLLPTIPPELLTERLYLPLIERN
ncbi:MAG: Zn-dependent exopeptidase M28 [Caldilinea sp. CFX5]|nr:Zn-dependent exopeptidase M28 [Caldilinea sp. CFX5]